MFSYWLNRGNPLDAADVSSSKTRFSHFSSCFLCWCTIISNLERVTPTSSCVLLCILKTAGDRREWICCFMCLRLCHCLSVSLCVLNPANLNKRESAESAPFDSAGAPFTGRSDFSIDLQCS
ncbi:hypothetical protein SRHO_G00149270 [Serrasalmus rhombeus]